MSIAVFGDFRGGYFTDVPSELMKDNELLTGLNCYWENGVRKRNGISNYATNSWATGVAVRGYHRLWVATLSAWYTILAIDDASAVTLYYSTSTGATQIASTTYIFTTGYNVEMDSLAGEVFAVNGVDKPLIVYATSGFVVNTLEAHDTKTRATANWAAGYYNATGTTTDLIWVDDTTDFKDAGTDDAILNAVIDNDGFWVACDYTFNRVRLYGSSALATDLVATYEYYKGSGTWGTCTMLSSLTLDAAATAHTLEWNYPTAWVVADANIQTTQTEGRYVFKVAFTTYPSATIDCDYIDVAHTQYLSQIFDFEKPRTVRVHKNHIFLGFENVINHSPYNQASGWRAGDVYYFEEGGRRIEAMVSHGDYLAVVKDGGIHGIFGDSYANFYQKYLSPGGTTAGKSVVNLGAYLFMADVDGIYRWDGEQRLKISKHIQTDYDNFSVSNVAGIAYKGYVYLSFPSGTNTLIFDPDTYRTDDMGDGRVSFWKFDNYRVERFCYHGGAGDSGYLIGVANVTDNAMLLRCDSGSYDSISATTAIDMQFQTKYFAFGNFELTKRYGRLKPKLQNQTANGVTYVVTMYGEDGTQSSSATFTVATGTGWWSSDIKTPYNIDGKSFGLKIQHNSITAAKIAGFSLDYQARRY